MQPAYFEYRISGHPGAIGPDDLLLQEHLPANRHAEAATESEKPVTLFTYFSAITDFLAPGLADLDRDTDSPVRIVMEKHGAFYHPASIHLCRNGRWEICYAVNVAVSRQGRSIISNEFSNLSRLQHRFPHTPRAIAMDTVTTEAGTPISLLQVEWLADFHEFHLTRHAGDSALIVWTPDGDRIITDPAVRTEFYRRSARILSDYYEPETGCQISPWHHAAGDFVVNLTGSLPEIRLITIRQYHPMFEPVPGTDLIAQLDGIWIFLVQMSVRMRLDRMDGIGEVAWADDTAVSGTVNGWFDAVKDYPLHAASNMALSDLILPYIDTRTDDDWISAAMHLLESTPAAAPEYPVIRDALYDHISCLRRELGRMLSLV